MPTTTFVNGPRVGEILETGITPLVPTLDSIYGLVSGGPHPFTQVYTLMEASEFSEGVNQRRADREATGLADTQAFIDAE